jgi:hypothetical protein
MHRIWRHTLLAAVAALVWPWVTPAQVGSEKAIPRHLRDGEEFEIGVEALLRHGEALFAAPWTIQEGGGRPLSKGTGAPLSDPASPLIFPRNLTASLDRVRIRAPAVMPSRAWAGEAIPLRTSSC